MAITNPAVVAALTPLDMFGVVKPALNSLVRLGARNVGADIRLEAIAPAGTSKVLLDTVSAAPAWNASSNNFLTETDQTYGSITAAAYRDGAGFGFTEIGEGSVLERAAELVKRRFTLVKTQGIVSRLSTLTATALNGVTASTGATVDASPTAAKYRTLLGDIATLGYDTLSMVLGVTPTEWAVMASAFAGTAAATVTPQQIADDLGVARIERVMGATGRIWAIPAGTLGFIAQAPTLPQGLGVESEAMMDAESGAEVGVVVAPNVSTGRLVVSAVAWLGITALSATADGTTTKGVLKVGTAT